MSLLLCLFTLSLMQAAQAHFTSRQCHFYQGPLGFCRNVDSINFTSIVLAKTAQMDDKSAAGGSNLPSWLSNFPLSIFGPLQAKNSTWTLRLPVHARTVFLGRMKDYQLVHSVVLNQADLDHRRVLVKADSDITKTSNCYLDPNQASFTLLINVTDQSIRDDAWYILCAEFNAVEDVSDGQPSKRAVNNTGNECIRCTMVKTITGTSPGPLQFLQYSWLKNQPLTNGKGAVLHYTVADLPFATAKVSGTVIDLVNSTTVFEFTRSIKPRQEVFFWVPQAEENGTYLVKTNLYPENENGTDFVIDNIKVPLVLTDYLRQDNSA